MRMKWIVGTVVTLAAGWVNAGCERNLPKAKADAVLLELAPDVVSSEDGSLHARATVVSGNTTLRNKTVRLLVTFEDQLGALRSVPGVTLETDRTGAVEHVFAGLLWAGAGTVTAEVLDGDGQPYLRGGEPVASEATFSVVDLSPPTALIRPGTADNRVGPNLPLDVEVDFSDEIGVSSVTLQAVGELNDTQVRIVASGSTGGTVTFELDVPGAAIPGPTIYLYALVEDLSGNITAAAPVTLTVDPTILIAVPFGLTHSVVAVGNGNFLDSPRAIAFSVRDSLLYVADASGGACGGGCIWQVNPANGAALLVTVGVGTIEGLGFSANGNLLYYTDRNDRIVQMTYNPGVAVHYDQTIVCNNLSTPVDPLPQDPFHIWIDGTNALFAEQNNKVLQRLDVAACLGAAETNEPADLGGSFDSAPWGVSQIPAGDYLVSVEQDDEIFRMTAGGNSTLFESARLDRPRGIDWLAGGANATYADSLMIASRGNQRVFSSRGANSSRTAVSLVDDPVDVALGANGFDGTLFVLTEPGGQGRIFAVSGF